MMTPHVERVQFTLSKTVNVQYFWGVYTEEASVPAEAEVITGLITR